jgi:hypothetical protein
VTVIQQWNGIKPSIKPLLYDFFIHLASTKLEEVQGIRVKRDTSRKFYYYWRTKNK